MNSRVSIVHLSIIVPSQELYTEEYWGTRQQLLAGKVIGDWVDKKNGPLDAIFGVLLQPTAGNGSSTKGPVIFFRPSTPPPFFWFRALKISWIIFRALGFYFNNNWNRSLHSLINTLEIFSDPLKLLNISQTPQTFSKNFTNPYNLLQVVIKGWKTGQKGKLELLPIMRCN